MAVVSSALDNTPRPSPPGRHLIIVANGRSSVVQDALVQLRSALDAASFVPIEQHGIGSLPSATAPSSYVVHVTQRRAHAIDIARETVETTLARIDSNKSTVTIEFVALGGDGTIHELINGACRAIDADPTTSAVAKKRLAIRIGHIACGSGNALAVSNGIDQREVAIQRVINADHAKPLIVSTVQVAPFVEADAADDSSSLCVKWPSSTDLMYSFCVVSWGLHAQIVKQSEALRIIGNRRFYYAAMFNVLMGFPYVGSLYTAAPDNDDTSSSTMLLSRTKIDRRFSYFIASKMSQLEKGFTIAPFADISSTQHDLIIANDLTQAQVIEMLTEGGKGGPLKLSFVENVKTRAFVLRPSSPSTFWQWLEGTGTSRTWLEFLTGSKRYSDVCVDGEMIRVNEGDALYVKTTPLQPFSLYC